MMARTAALSGAGSFAQAVTIRVRSGQEGIEFRESIRESSSDFPIKSGGERGFEQSQSNSREANLQSDSANGQAPASLTASQKPVQACPELAELSQAWPKLPANVRTAIVALIRATLNSTAL
jgi:hypothetical protein